MFASRNLTGQEYMYFTTIKILKAIKFATKTHEVYQKQKRKGKDIAYITHPLTVGMLLSQAGASEDTVIAGILHDTIEDSAEHKKVTVEMLEKRFGKKVAEGVLSVTETDKNLSWEERKKEALEHIEHFSEDSLLIKSADIIANVSELLDDYARHKDSIFEIFNAPKERIIKNQLITIRAIVQRWKENPLKGDLTFLASKLQEMNGVSFMSQNSARVIEYKDYDENEKLECPICGWKGTPKSSEYVNMDSDYCIDVCCPVCSKMLLVAGFPKA